MSSHPATYQGRLALNLDQEAFLSDYAIRYNHVERTLYADKQRTGNKAATFKNDYLIRFGITARQFNAIARNLEGKIASVRRAGAIGIDINADCLAVSETDHYGNLVGSRVIPLVTYGKDSDQAGAIIGEAIKVAVSFAADARKPVVIENLDFSKKKAAMEAEDPEHARMISTLSYNKIIQGVKSRANRSGVEVLEINPAYTSTIGAVNYARRYGISTHQAAALAIARRGLGFVEKPVRRPVVPVRNGGHVTLPVPARKHGKHVWTQWAAIRKELTAVHVAHARSGARRTEPAPLRLLASLGSTWTLPVRSRYANRQQHCSAGVMDDIPW